MRNNYSEEDYEYDSNEETNFKEYIDNYNLTEGFNDKSQSYYKRMKLPYKVDEVLVLKSGELIVASSWNIILLDNNYKIKIKKEEVTNNGIQDMCLIDQNTFAVCSSKDIIILEIMENNFKINKKLRKKFYSLF